MAGADKDPDDSADRYSLKDAAEVFGDFDQSFDGFGVSKSRPPERQSSPKSAADVPLGRSPDSEVEFEQEPAENEADQDLRAARFELDQMTAANPVALSDEPLDASDPVLPVPSKLTPGSDAAQASDDAARDVSVNRSVTTRPPKPHAPEKRSWPIVVLTAALAVSFGVGIYLLSGALSSNKASEPARAPATVHQAVHKPETTSP